MNLLNTLWGLLQSLHPDGNYDDYYPDNQYASAHLKDGRHIGLGIEGKNTWVDITLSFEYQQIGLYSGIIESTDQMELILRLTSHHPHLNEE